MSIEDKLKLAAKAASIELKKDHDGNFYYHFDLGNGDYKHWHPELDDGDALRLANLLHIDITRYPSTNEVAAVRHHHHGLRKHKSDGNRFFVKYVENQDEAVRLAVLTVAAMIGADL